MRIERELLDLVNGDDVVIGTVYRDNYQDIVEGNLGYIRVSEMFILNAAGKIWTLVRTATKKIAPNGYDYGAAGHVGSGDSYVETIIREAQEEVNLSITASDLEFVTKIRTDKVKIFRSVFVLRSDVTPEFNTDDFVSAEWLTSAELIDNIRQGHPAKDGMIETVEALQHYLTAHSAKAS